MPTHEETTEPFDELAQANDAWTADPERTRSDFFLSDRVRVLKADAPSVWPEYVIMATLAVVCVVCVYLALVVM